MTRTLIGYSGFVGSSLLRQSEFDCLFGSNNISSLGDTHTDTVFCAAAPAQKWVANRDPEADRKNIEHLIFNIKRVKCNRFVLISTVDVFKDSIGVYEDTCVDEDGLPPYGLHRRMLEKFVESHFDDHLIVRLPGLVGPGLRKNVIFDFLNDNNLHAIDCRSVFQFYPIVNLWHDIEAALKHRLRLVHLTAEQISVRDVSTLGFNKPFDHVLTSPPVTYDMRTRHAVLFGGTGDFQYSRRESLQAIRAYAQSEPRTLKSDGATGK